MHSKAFIGSSRPRRAPCPHQKDQGDVCCCGLVVSNESGLPCLAPLHVPVSSSWKPQVSLTVTAKHPIIDELPHIHPRTCWRLLNSKLPEIILTKQPQHGQLAWTWHSHQHGQQEKAAYGAALRKSVRKCQDLPTGRRLNTVMNLSRQSPTVMSSKVQG